MSKHLTIDKWYVIAIFAQKRKNENENKREEIELAEWMEGIFMCVSEMS